MSTEARVLSNKRVTVWMGPASGIANYAAPTLAEITALRNISEAVKWSGFSFNLAKSDEADDRSLMDEAGTKTRTITQFGGVIEFFTPPAGDTASIFRLTRNIVKVPRTQLAVVIRTVTLNSVGIAVGDEVNAYRVITDSNRHNSGPASYSYTINFIPQDLVGVNCIVPAATAVAVVALPAGPVSISLATGGASRSTASYGGRNVTIGAVWVSSSPLVATVSKHGIIIPLSVGTTNVSCTYPGSAAGTARVVTVTA